MDEAEWSISQLSSFQKHFCRLVKNKCAGARISKDMINLFNGYGRCVPAAGECVAQLHRRNPCLMVIGNGTNLTSVLRRALDVIYYDHLQLTLARFQLEPQLVL